MQTGDYPLRLCEYHLERKGVAVPASHVVNDEGMCARCFAGFAIFNFEKIGDTDGDVESGARRRTYLAKNPEARARLRERKRLRNALWRERQRALLAKNSKFASLPLQRKAIAQKRYLRSAHGCGANPEPGQITSGLPMKWT